MHPFVCVLMCTREPVLERYVLMLFELHNGSDRARQFCVLCRHIRQSFQLYWVNMNELSSSG